MKIEPVRFQRLPVAHMFVDYSYQREQKDSNVREILKSGWDNLRCQPLCVSERANGKYAIVDGGHRWKAATIAAVKTLPCMVYTGLSVEQEAELYILLNTGKIKVHASEIFKAKLLAEDPDAVAISKITSAYDFKLGVSTANNTIVAANAIMKAYSRYGEDAFTEAMHILRKAWNGESASLNGNFIIGLSRFAARVEPTAEQVKTLSEKLSKLSPLQVMQKASGLKALTGNGVNEETFAQVFGIIYNERLSAKRKIDLELFGKSYSSLAGSKKKITAPLRDASGNFTTTRTAAPRPAAPQTGFIMTAKPR